MKEFLYIGYYEDTQGEIVLKIGTTNDLNAGDTNTTPTTAKQQIIQCQGKTALSICGNCHSPNTILCGTRIKIAQNGLMKELVNLYETTAS